MEVGVDLEVGSTIAAASEETVDHQGSSEHLTCLTCTQFLFLGVDSKAEWVTASDLRKVALEVAASKASAVLLVVDLEAVE